MSRLAIIYESIYPNQRQSIRLRPTPEPLPGQVQVKIHATAVNPIFDYGKFVTTFPTVLGTDAAGEVMKIGSDVAHFRYNSQGDTSNGDKATFQQYCLADADIACKIPSALDYDSASTIPVAAVTAAAALYDLCLGLTAPWVPGGEGLYQGRSLVVLARSSSVGSYAIQLAALSGFRVVTTSSRGHTPYLQSIGASVVVDRSSPALVADIEAAAGGDVEYLLDAISSPETLRAAIEIVKPGGRIARVLRTEESTETAARKKGVQMRFAHGSSHTYPDFNKAFWKAMESYLERGVIKPNRAKVLPGGLRAWEAAYELHRSGQVSGEKIVLRPQETVD
ncbi:NAD(P)-binding protein [Heliocybe sulcata]|uniref:NAD(P)-binding protein n=1 Tax=Heliocybe sulcata TaxID=5364 RepID=A0A5C3N6X1_9AGAM|nr:NAD(P)-binding protein [Heliocybe sulcata]